MVHTEDENVARECMRGMAELYATTPDSGGVREAFQDGMRMGLLLGSGKGL